MNLFEIRYGIKTASYPLGTGPTPAGMPPGAVGMSPTLSKPKSSLSVVESLMGLKNKAQADRTPQEEVKPHNVTGQAKIAAAPGGSQPNMMFAGRQESVGMAKPKLDEKLPHRNPYEESVAAALAGKAGTKTANAFARLFGSATKSMANPVGKQLMNSGMGAAAGAGASFGIQSTNPDGTQSPVVNPWMGALAGAAVNHGGLRSFLAKGKGLGMRAGDTAVNAVRQGGIGAFAGSGIDMGLGAVGVGVDENGNSKGYGARLGAVAGGLGGAGRGLVRGIVRNPNAGATATGVAGTTGKLNQGFDGFVKGHNESFSAPFNWLRNKVNGVTKFTDHTGAKFLRDAAGKVTPVAASTPMQRLGYAAGVGSTGLVAAGGIGGMVNNAVDKKVQDVSEAAVQHAKDYGSQLMEGLPGQMPGYPQQPQMQRPPSPLLDYFRNQAQRGAAKVLLTPEQRTGLGQFAGAMS